VGQPKLFQQNGLHNITADARNLLPTANLNDELLVLLKFDSTNTADRARVQRRVQELGEVIPHKLASFSKTQRNLALAGAQSSHGNVSTRLLVMLPRKRRHRTAKSDDNDIPNYGHSCIPIMYPSLHGIRPQKLAAQFFVLFMSDRDFSEEEAALQKEMDDTDGSDAEEPYSAPHCSTCHDALAGVGAKAHKKECSGYDKHKMKDCPHPGTRWRKTHHAKEVRLGRKIDRLRRERPSETPRRVCPAFSAFCKQCATYHAVPDALVRGLSR
jgi:hypothetical protein